MQLVVNGEPHNHRGHGTLTALLAELGAPPERVAVMVNDQVIPRPRRDEIRLAAGDRVEVIVFAGGG